MVMYIKMSYCYDPDLWENEMKHIDIIETQRYKKTHFLFMNKICRNCKNAEWNKLVRMVATYL